MYVYVLLHTLHDTLAVFDIQLSAAKYIALEAKNKGRVGRK